MQCDVFITAIMILQNLLGMSTWAFLINLLEKFCFVNNVDRETSFLVTKHAGTNCKLLPGCPASLYPNNVIFVYIKSK